MGHNAAGIRHSCACSGSGVVVVVFVSSHSSERQDSQEDQTQPHGGDVDAG